MMIPLFSAASNGGRRDERRENYYSVIPELPVRMLVKSKSVEVMIHF
jgi:hypothetical protein